MKEHEGKNISWLMIICSIRQDWRNKRHNKFDDTNRLIHMDDKLPDNITSKGIGILMTCVIKDDGKFYPQISL